MIRLCEQHKNTQLCNEQWSTTHFIAKKKIIPHKNTILTRFSHHIDCFVCAVRREWRRGKHKSISKDCYYSFGTIINGLIMILICRLLFIFSTSNFSCSFLFMSSYLFVWTSIKSSGCISAIKHQNCLFRIRGFLRNESQLYCLLNICCNRCSRRFVADPITIISFSAQ